MNPYFNGITALGTIGTLIVIVVTVIAFLMPFFVLKIRNEVVAMRGQMGRIISLLEVQNKLVRSYQSVKPVIKTADHWNEVICQTCGHINRKADTNCASCGEALVTKQPPEKEGRGIVCKKCGYKNFEGSIRCLGCGGFLTERA